MILDELFSSGDGGGRGGRGMILDSLFSSDIHTHTLQTRLVTLYLSSHATNKVFGYLDD